MRHAIASREPPPRKRVTSVPDPPHGRRRRAARDPVLLLIQHTADLAASPPRAFVARARPPSHTRRVERHRSKHHAPRAVHLVLPCSRTATRPRARGTSRRGGRRARALRRGNSSRREGVVRRRARMERGRGNERASERRAARHERASERATRRARSERATSSEARARIEDPPPKEEKRASEKAHRTSNPRRHHGNTTARKTTEIFHVSTVSSVARSRITDRRDRARASPRATRVARRSVGSDATTARVRQRGTTKPTRADDEPAAAAAADARSAEPAVLAAERRLHARDDRDEERTRAAVERARRAQPAEPRARELALEREQRPHLPPRERWAGGGVARRSELSRVDHRRESSE